MKRLKDLIVNAPLKKPAEDEADELVREMVDVPLPPAPAEGIEGTVTSPGGQVRHPDTPGPFPPPPSSPRTRPAAPRSEVLQALKGGPER